ncbi:hypothetical protein ABZ621_29270 [Streptomyces sp. NPDC007863]|uniref:hypothetical protein n=1 Tax=Streptomyces sp. NPDC007863 TaxID=3154894 RepID=UPI0033CFA01C
MSQWVVSPLRGNPVGEIHTVSLNRGDPVGFKIPDDKIFLEASIKFTITQRERDVFGQPVGAADRYKVSTRGYMYSVTSSDDEEQIAWHWHPTGSSDVEYPHSHIGSAALNPNGLLKKKHHLRTGRMTFEGVVFNMITQWGVTPRNLNYEEILEENQATFDKWKSWG